MANPKTDKASKVQPLREDGAPSAALLPTRPTAFNFTGDDESGPELTILSASAKPASPIAPMSGIDLSHKKKIIFWIGRGKTGKTTGIRWSAETAILAGHTLLMADMDPTNDTFSKYIDDVARPPQASDPAMASNGSISCCNMRCTTTCLSWSILAVATPRLGAWSLTCLTSWR